MRSIWGIVLVSSCVFAGPVPRPYSHFSYHQPNPFLDNNANDFQLYQHSSNPLQQGVYYAQFQSQPESQPGVYLYKTAPVRDPYTQHPFDYPHQVPPHHQQQQQQQYVVIPYNRPSNQPTNQVVQENQNFPSAFVAQLNNAFRNHYEQRPSAIQNPPQQHPSELSLNSDSQNQRYKEIAALVYGIDMGAVQQIPSIVYSSVGSSGANPELESSLSTGEQTVQKPEYSQEEFFQAGENVSPEPTPGESSSSSTQDVAAPTQDDINTKYPVTILTPGGASTDVSLPSANENTDRVPAAADEFDQGAATTTSPEVDTTPTGSVGDSISSSITPTTGPPPEWDILAENLNLKDGEDETTVSAAEPPPK